MPQKENLSPVEEPVLEPVEEVRKNVDLLLAARQAWLHLTFEETNLDASQVQKNLPLLKAEFGFFVGLFLKQIYEHRFS